MEEGFDMPKASKYHTYGLMDFGNMGIPGKILVYY